ncbi:hypothetical protein BC827DRAFT_1186989 [Russula dissimulans]|nr:hypothetical protein BC827DRAFT_1186989 [Russula dissimulans]
MSSLKVRLCSGVSFKFIAAAITLTQCDFLRSKGKTEWASCCLRVFSGSAVGTRRRTPGPTNNSDALVASRDGTVGLEKHRAPNCIT